jgi:AmiR/NasT family two-component response regulator
MERHGLSADDAYALLRDHARSTRSRVADVAAAVLEAGALLRAPPPRDR